MSSLSCACVVDHNPNPMRFHVHHIVPSSWGGSDDPSNLVTLCPTTHNNVHAYLNHMIRADGEPSWFIRRKFGVYARQLAGRAWAAWTAANPDERPPWTMGEIEAECELVGPA